MTSFVDDTPSPSTTWGNDTQADTTTRNWSRFLPLEPDGDADGYVDFLLYFRDSDPVDFYITEADPVVFHDLGDKSI